MAKLIDITIHDLETWVRQPYADISHSLVRDALELLKEKTEDAVKKASEGVMPMAYWIGGRCSNCECDAPSFLSGSDWKESMTPYCPNCGARMENPDGEDGDGE